MEEITVGDVIQDIEVDPFNPFENEISVGENIYFFVMDYLASILHLIICAAVLISSGLFCYVMYKFERLRTRTNYILLNFLIVNSGYNICATIIPVLDSYAFSLECMIPIFLLRFGFWSASLLLSLLLAIDWFLSANFNSLFVKYTKFYKWVIMTSYLFMFIYIVLHLNLENSEEINVILTIICGLLYLTCILCIAALNIIKLGKSYTQEVLQTSYALTVSNIFLLLWLPFVLFFIGEVLADYFLFIISLNRAVLLVCLLYGSELVGSFSPVVIIIVLGRIDKNFGMSYHSIFRRSLKGYTQSIGDTIND